MNNLATHLDNHQVELDSLPDAILDQLNIEPSFLNGVRDQSPWPSSFFTYPLCLHSTFFVYVFTAYSLLLF